jgi:hypothetical protein
MDTDRLPNDDDLCEKAKIAMQMIKIILADLPPRWQFAIVKALGARIILLHELQREQPPGRRTLSA